MALDMTRQSLRRVVRMQSSLAFPVAAFAVFSA
jgi:hypothetical protein